MDNRDYGKILHISLGQNRCRVLKSDEEGRDFSEASFSDWRKDMAGSGMIHENDTAQFLEFLTPEHIEETADCSIKERRILCRIRSGGGWRWHILELHQDPDGAYLLCARDIHDLVREGLVRENLDIRTLEQVRQDIQLAGILKSRFKIMTTVFLDSGQCRRVMLDMDPSAENTRLGDYSLFIERAIGSFVHPDDAADYWNTLSLDHLREKAAKTEDYAEEVCVYRQRGEPVHWIELRVIYAREGDQMSVNILGQDITREKKQEESRTQALEERAYMISSLSTLFFSTYYIDLEQNTFRAVTQLRRVEDLLGEEVDCTAGFNIYANHFIHPDDREEYLRVMNCENLRQSLRWWQPYVAVEYRKLPDFPENGECEWVRATAVLARSGADDLPKNAIYVAQSISGSRHQAS